MTEPEANLHLLLAKPKQTEPGSYIEFWEDNLAIKNWFETIDKMYYLKSRQLDKVVYL